MLHPRSQRLSSALLKPRVRKPSAGLVCRQWGQTGVWRGQGVWWTEQKLAECSVFQACYERGNEVSVVPKTAASTDSPWMGLAKYAWSGWVSVAGSWVCLCLQAPGVGFQYLSAFLVGTWSNVPTAAWSIVAGSTGLGTKILWIRWCGQRLCTCGLE